VEALTDAIGLRALGFGARVIDVLDGEVELKFVSFRVASILTLAVGQHAQQLDIVLLKERYNPVIAAVIGVLRSYSLAQATFA
jgi:hypothetical protein